MSLPLPVKDWFTSILKLPAMFPLLSPPSGAPRLLTQRLLHFLTQVLTS